MENRFKITDVIRTRRKFAFQDEKDSGFELGDIVCHRRGVQEKNIRIGHEGVVCGPCMHDSATNHDWMLVQFELNPNDDITLECRVDNYQIEHKKLALGFQKGDRVHIRIHEKRKGVVQGPCVAEIPKKEEYISILFQNEDLSYDLLDYHVTDYEIELEEYLYCRFQKGDRVRSMLNAKKLNIPLHTHGTVLGESKSLGSHGFPKICVDFGKGIGCIDMRPDIDFEHELLTAGYQKFDIVTLTLEKCRELYKTETNIPTGRVLGATINKDKLVIFIKEKKNTDSYILKLSPHDIKCVEIVEGFCKGDIVIAKRKFEKPGKFGNWDCVETGERGVVREKSYEKIVGCDLYLLWVDFSNNNKSRMKSYPASFLEKSDTLQNANILDSAPTNQEVDVQTGTPHTQQIKENDKNRGIFCTCLHNH